jgi:hypothetical protein
VEAVPTAGLEASLRAAARPLSLLGLLSLTRVLKSKHQAASQGVRRFGKRSIFDDM